jgi:hypothetical protein
MLSDEKSRLRILSEITESDFNNPEAASVFLKIYQLFEEGEAVKLNNILIDFDEKFKDFMIGFVLSQEKVFSGEGETAGTDNPEKKMRTACSDSLKKVALRKIGSKIRILNAELKYTEDPEKQNDILQKISGLKQEQIELTKN